MAKAIVTVATSSYAQLLKYTQPLFQKYAARIGAELIVLTDRKCSWWGLEKFRVREYCEKYDRIMFVDADVVIHPKADNLFESVPDHLVGMHDDYAFLQELKRTSWIETSRSELLLSQGVSSVSYNTVYNTGVIVASQQHADIWNPLVEPFPKHHCDEQFWIEYQSYKYGIYPLEATHNWQWWFRHFKRNPTPQFKHYANCPLLKRLAFMRRDTEVYNGY